MVWTLADVIENLFDTDVNRKVDGTFTDLTQEPGHWLINRNSC
jgi:hypothetical protein